MTKHGMVIKTDRGTVEVSEWEIAKVLSAFADGKQVAAIVRMYHIDERIVRHVINNCGM